MAVKPAKVIAPVLGWNTRDPVAAMNQADAISITNLVPGTDGVAVRPGFKLSHTLVATSYPVATLIPWKTPYGERMIAACPITAANHGLYDITTTGVNELKTGFIGSKWSGSALGSSIGLVNGTDSAQQLSFTPGTGVSFRAMTISGPATNVMKSIHVFKSRSYFALGDEPAFWYSEIDALGGELTKFPIDRVALTGGNVTGISSWTVDGGAGPDDYFVLFLDTGEVLVYQGSNPGDVNDWAIVGRYVFGKVLAHTQFAGKIHVVTDQDYNVLPDDLVTQGLQRPSKLSGAAKAAVSRDATDNWQILFAPKIGWRIVNVPYGSKREQHILDLRSGGATRFDIDAYVWARFRGDLYFGGAAGKVYKIEGSDDNGASIEFSCQQAFSDFGVPHNKTVLMYRPMWSTQGTLNVDSGLAYDYDSREFMQSNTEVSDGPPWDTSPWELTSWGVGQGSKSAWLTGGGEGQSVSLVMNGTTTKPARWHHTDYRIDVARDLV